MYILKHVSWYDVIVFIMSACAAIASYFHITTNPTITENIITLLGIVVPVINVYYHHKTDGQTALSATIK